MPDAAARPGSSEESCLPLGLVRACAGILAVCAEPPPSAAAAGAQDHDLSRRSDRRATCSTSSASSGTPTKAPVTRTPGALIGKVARRTLIAGKPIPLILFAMPEVIKQGKPVRVVFSEGGADDFRPGRAAAGGRRRRCAEPAQHR